MSLPAKDYEATVQLVIDDLRRLYDEVSRNYNNLKGRVLGLIVGEVAIVSFIFSGGGINFSKLTPAEKIFFNIGVFLLATCFGMLLWAVSTAYWEIPLDLKASKELYKRFDSKFDYMEHMKEDIEHCTEYGLKKLSARSRVYNITLFVLSAAIIIMLVIKFTRPIGG